MAEIAIIGAGPAGLMAAWKASLAGHDCTVFEAESSVGGMAGSLQVAGQRVDFGSHRLHPATQEAILAELRGLLGTDLQTRERNGRIRFDERWVAFPLRAADMVRRLPKAISLRAGIDALSGPFRRSSGESFLDEVASRLGPTVAEMFYAPYANKLYGVAATELDSELARRRVSAKSPIEIARRLIKASKPTGRVFLYPRRGYGQIAEALTEAATAAGANIRLGSPVSRIVENRWGVMVGSDGSDHDFDRVLSTVPVRNLAAAFEPRPPPEVMSAIEQCRTRAMLLVYLVIDRAQYTTFDAHYFPGSDTTIARLSEPKNYRDGPDPRDQTVLCAEIACWSTDEIWTWSDDDLGELVAANLEASGLPKPSQVATQTRRLASVYPVYERSTMVHRATADAWVGSLDRILSFGRQGLSVPDNLHHVLAMGESAAEALNGNGSIDRARWERSLVDFAGHVVED